jgi:hypothetical protein
MSVRCAGTRKHLTEREGARRAGSRTESIDALPTSPLPRWAVLPLVRGAATEIAMAPRRWARAESSRCCKSRSLSAPVGFHIVIIPGHHPLCSWRSSSLSILPSVASRRGSRRRSSLPLSRSGGEDRRSSSFFRSPVSGYCHYHLYLLVQKKKRKEITFLRGWIRVVSSLRGSCVPRGAL